MIAGGWGALLRVSIHPAAAIFTRVLFGLRLEGTRFVPRRGPALLVANHQGYLDPLFLQMATARPVRFMMTSDFYDVPWVRPFFRAVGAIRVPTGGPPRGALRQGQRILDRGGLVGIFPEGKLSRDGRIGEALPGAAFLAARTGAPVVPARISGSIRVLPWGEWLPRQAEVRIRFGEPIRVARRRDPGAARRILQAVAAL